MFLTGSQETLQRQEAQGDSHDGGFVQLRGNAARKRKSAGQLVENFRLFAPPASGRVTRTQLPLLRTGPTGGGRRGRGVKNNKKQNNRKKFKEVTSKQRHTWWNKNRDEDRK